MLLELQVAGVASAFARGILDGAVHPLDSAVRPGLLNLSEKVISALLLAARVEHMSTGGVFETSRVT